MVGTHTFTKIGVVDNTCTKQIMGTILLLEKELHVTHTLLDLLVKDGQTLFTETFESDKNILIQQLSDLNHALGTQIAHLATFHTEHSHYVVKV